MSQKLGLALNGLKSPVNSRANKVKADPKAERKADGGVYNMALAMVNIANKKK